MVVVLLVGAVAAFALKGEDRGSEEARAGAVRAVADLAATVVRPDPSAREICQAVGPRTRRALATLAGYLAQPERSCGALPVRVLRITLEPLAGTGGKPLEATVDGSDAVVRIAGGPEVSRASLRGRRWKADPAAGGVGAWRLETARRCSATLTSARLTPLSVDPARYRQAMITRLRGVSSVLDMLQRAPDGLADRVAEPRAALTELRDGLRRGLRAVSGGNLSRDAPDPSQLPSLLQLLESFPALRDLGVPCLGGPAAPRATVDVGNRTCLRIRQPVDGVYRTIGRATDLPTVAGQFDRLVGIWTQVATTLQGIDLAGAGRLTPVRVEAVASAERAAALAGALAGAARAGGEDATAADQLNLAQQALLDGLIALGFGWCGNVGV
ncbi:hypothetical protein [Patulibacter defluvii]|uniref:hypothetical protein n=1 Tax=Patulibacter defluvii TaxID=3095358 RepID=UPI002A7586AE|nr:hypothetical protein [Patulibacter sp. DM4]